MARAKLRCIMGCPGLKSSYREKGLLAALIRAKIINLKLDPLLTSEGWVGWKKPLFNVSYSRLKMGITPKAQLLHVIQTVKNT